MADSTANSSDNLADAGNPHEGLKDMDMDLQLQDFSVEAIVSKLDELKKMFEQDICGPLLEKAKQVVKESEEFEQEKARCVRNVLSSFGVSLALEADQALRC